MQLFGGLCFFVSCWQCVSFAACFTEPGHQGSLQSSSSWSSSLVFSPWAPFFQPSHGLYDTSSWERSYLCFLYSTVLQSILWDPLATRTPEFPGTLASNQPIRILEVETGSGEELGDLYQPLDCMALTSENFSLLKPEQPTPRNLNSQRTDSPSPKVPACYFTTWCLLLGLN